MITSTQLKALYFFGLLLWGAVLFSQGQPVTVSFFKPSSYVLPCLLIAAGIFERWGWRISLLYPWFVTVPDLRGTYRGELISSWVDPTTQQKISPITTFMVIRQTLLTIHVRLYTGESESSAVLGGFVPSADGQQRLIYSYRNEPRADVRHRSPIHYGSVSLGFDQAGIRLDGSYWTDRATTGEMHFARISREACQSVHDCEALAARSTP